MLFEGYGLQPVHQTFGAHAALAAEGADLEALNGSSPIGFVVKNQVAWRQVAVREPQEN